MDTLKKYLKELESIKQSRGYLGELILQEDELQELFESLANADLGKNSREIIACLTIAAVNCAFYYYDDAFWKHFCSRVGHSYKEEFYGEMILKFLKEEGFIRYEEIKSGPYKYVSQIRLQSGIAKRDIPQFAQFVKDLCREDGVSNAIVMPLAKFHKAVNKLPDSAKYLKRFLKSESGWGYTKDVLRHIEAGYTLEELKKVKGFHPDLWQYIFRENEFAYLTDTIKYKLPYLSFRPDSYQIGISFDKKGISEHAYRMYGITVRREFLPVGTDELPLKDKYYGEIYIQHDGCPKIRQWIVDGWNPLKERFAIFKATPPYKYVKNKKNILPDKYFLIIPEDLDVHNELSKLKVYEEEYIELFKEESYIDFKVYCVYLKPDITIESLGIKILPAVDIRIEWEKGGQKLEGVIDNIVVWIEKIKPLRISIPSDLKNKIVIYYDLGNGKERVEPSQIKDNLLSVDIPYGTKGKVWIKPFGRSQIPEDVWESTEKFFCRFPKCDLQWPKGLLSYNEKPLIVLKSNESIEVEWSYPEGIIDISEESEKRWLLPEECQRVEGSIRYRDLDIRIAHPIFRANFEPKILWLEDLFKRKNITISSLPQNPFILCLFNNESCLEIYEGKKVPKNGKTHLISDDIIDPLKNFKYPVGRFVIKIDDVIKNTGSVFIHSENLIKSCKEGYIGSDYINYLPDKIRSLIDIVLKIRSGLLEHIGQTTNEYIESCDSEKLKQWIAKHFICANVFDNYNCLGFYMEQLDERWNNFYRWAKDCKSMITKDMNYDINTSKKYFDEGTRFCKLIDELSVERWSHILRLWLKKLETRSRIELLLKEWKKKLEEGPIDNWSCEITNMRGGSKITRAWYFYMKDKYDEAYRSLNQPEVLETLKEVNEIIDALQSVVKILSLLKSGRSEQNGDFIISKFSNTYWKDSFCILEAICLLFNSKTIECNRIKEIDKNLLLMLPIHNTDRDLFKIIIDFTNGIIDKNRWLEVSKENWFSAWILFNLANQLGLEITDKIALFLKIHSIPSPIRFEIEKIITQEQKS